MSDPQQSQYVLDSNVFMEAARRYYAFDIAPAFWHGLVAHAGNGRVCSIDRVKDEIDRGNDELKEWANSDFHSWFATTDQADVISAYGRIMVFVNGQDQYTDAAKADFSRVDNADAWIVAYALAKGHCVVTHEQFDPNARAKVPMPNVCRPLSVPWTDTFQMLRDLGIRLV